MLGELGERQCTGDDAILIKGSDSPDLRLSLMLAVTLLCPEADRSPHRGTHVCLCHALHLDSPAACVTGCSPQTVSVFSRTSELFRKLLSGSVKPDWPHFFDYCRLQCLAACSSTAEPDPLQGSVLVHGGARSPPGQRARPRRSPIPSRAACSSTAEPDPLQGARPRRSPIPSRAACSSTVEADPLQGSVLVHGGGRPPPGQRLQQQRRAVCPCDTRSSALHCRHAKEVETLCFPVLEEPSSRSFSEIISSVSDMKFSRSVLLEGLHQRCPHGPYNSSSWVFDRSTPRVKTPEACRVNSKPWASLQPRRV
ncbi:hypothetical protein ABFV05_018395 [Capra hircus]